MGLVEYASSDDESEDENHEVQTDMPQVVEDVAEKEVGSHILPEPLNNPSSMKEKDSINSEARAIGPVTQSSVPLGPSLPPIDGSLNTGVDLLEQGRDQQEASSLAPSSPYSTTRALIHDLTLPSVPNLEIPPSPPGSPPLQLSKKLDQFLALKRKGTHFNSKLEQSSALKNPALMDKLLDYAGIDDTAQYETTLSSDLWNVSALPDWAFRDRLKKTREKLLKEKETSRAAGSRTAIDFVAPTSSSAANTSDTASGGLSGRGEKRKGGWK